MNIDLKISIITVAYNSETTIRDTIESVISQTYPNIEYIIVDGKSTDKTLDIVNEYREKISLVISEPDKGIYDAMNKGITYATGDVIGILNSDDFYETTDALEYMANQIILHPEVDIFFGDLVFCKQNNTTIVTRIYQAKSFKPWKLRFGWMPPHPSTFIRKKAYNLVGSYSLKYKISADYEMFVRMLFSHKLSYKWCNKILVRMRQGGISTSGYKNSLNLNKEIVSACKYNGLYTNIILVMLKIPFKLLELTPHFRRTEQ